MDIRSLEVFLGLSEELHFGRAAEKLAMGQSTVSEHIRRLEARIGKRLFERTSRKVTLTTTGEILAQRLRDPLQSIQMALREAAKEHSPHQQKLRISFLGGGFYELYEPLIKRHQSTWPRVDLEFIESSYSTQFSAIEDGEVDLGFCRLPVSSDRLETGPIIMSDPRVVCVNESHPLAKRNFIDAEELRGETMLSVSAAHAGKKWQEYHFPLSTPDGYPLKLGPTIRTVREGVSAAIAGHGIFFLTKRAAQYFATPRMSVVEVNLPPIQSALVWRRGDTRSILAAFNQTLLHVANDNIG